MYYAEQWRSDDSSQQRANTVERTNIWTAKTLSDKLKGITHNLYFGVRIPASALDGTEIIEIWGKRK